MKSREERGMNRQVVVFLAIVIVSVAACNPSRPDSQSARVDKLFADWNRTDTPGCAVGISRNGGVVYERGYGMANLELSVPIIPTTVFSIASISKAFTAMSVLLAAERGQLSLDDEVQKYIPEWADHEHHVTIRQVLTHTSGLREGFGLLGWAAPADGSGDPNEGILKMLARQHGLNFAPGTEYQYNNSGYNLLGSILKRATGQSLRAFADANIFKPLGMTHTHVQDDPAMLVPNRASGYSRNANGWHPAQEAAGVVGNAGMQSTVGDLLLWAQNFADLRVGSPALVASMQTPTVLEDGKTTDGGMGLALGKYRGVRMVETAGGDHGIASEVMRYPDQRLAVAVLCNVDSVVMGATTTVNPDDMVNGVADIYLADVLAARSTSTTAAPAVTPVKLSDDELSSKAGLYRLVGRDLPVLITLRQGTLMLRSYYQDEYDFEVTPVGANQFLFQGRVPLEFVPATAGRPKEWHVGEGKDQRLWQLVTFAPSATDLQSYVGDYRSEEIGVTYTIVERGSVLIVENPGRAEIPVQPFSRDVFVGDSVGIVKFSRDARGALSGFTVNRENDRGVRFDRMKRATDKR
jgi:CubicO group peptidase (beta-lactamase class C family)